MRIIDDDRRAIWQTIDTQLSAFRRGDCDAAFALASPGIRAVFGTPVVFMEMIRSGYPALHRPRRVSFGELVALDGQLAQQVRVWGADHESGMFLFLMERQRDGTWRVNGCVTVAEGRGAHSPHPVPLPGGEG
ncbi:MAG: DUF4864 domain-containing protein [Myxococcaceae bacterium]|nr:DUF4864 domain-containing protein [Myxococcaceae bacterium]